MGVVRFDISMSLDGFIAGPDDNVEQGLGRGGEQLHEWLYDLASWRGAHGMEGGEPGTDSDVLAEAMEGVGAVVMGRRMFDLAEDAWGDEPPFHMPVFVVTHRGREPLEKRGTTFSFVTEGPERALDLAREAAGEGNVSVAGGASVAQQLLRAGRVDEVQVHLVPVLLGGGRRLFEELGGVTLEQDRVIESNRVAHLRYRVVR